MKKQIVVIGGGDTFRNYEEYLSFLKDFEIDFERMKNGRKDWKSSLQEKLGEAFEVIIPQMPNKTNAQYQEWKIWFEKLFPFLEKEIVLIGHSLGGTFLAKYLSENDFPKKIKGLFLISACFGDYQGEYFLASFELPKSLEKLDNQVDKIFLYHSKDDEVVPFTDVEKYKKSLPRADVFAFEDKGHFNQEEFPKLVDNIKSLYK